MADIADKITSSMPELSHLRCEKCAVRKEIEDVALYFRSGWPKHCGYTMRLVTKAEEEQLLNSLGTPSGGTE